MTRIAFIKRTLAWVAPLFISIGGCGMSSYGCKDLWRAVLESKSASEERERAQRFSACAAKESMSYVLEFADRASGKTVPAASVASAAAPLTVHIRMSHDVEAQTWQPLDNASVLELLAE